MTDLVVGADIGGTSTRVGVSDTAGTVLAVAAGGPGNPNTVGIEGSAAQIRSVIDRALGSTEGRVLAVVIGLAGGSRTVAVPGFLRAAMPDRVDALAQLVGDPTVAFCSATPARRGYVLVAGTGAIAGEVVGDDLVQQRDGWGWLLGDEGSGFWMGRAAVRATLAALQRAEALGPLHEAVLDTSDTRDYVELLQASYAATPTWLAQFSALVSAHAADDPVAAGIAAEAVSLLERLFLSLDPEPELPVVLGGSVLTKPGPVSAALRERLAARPGAEVLTSSSGVIGALWIALRRHVAESTDAHDRLVASAAPWL
ncbi:MAG: BadF/BadG/BcrA/BcrD ATPase family protein [Propionibacteriaceae bacterium]